MKNITLNDVYKKHCKILAFLIISGGLGYVLATYVAHDPMLTAVFAPAINYILYSLENELDKTGFVKALQLQMKETKLLRELVSMHNL